MSTKEITEEEFEKALAGFDFLLPGKQWTATIRAYLEQERRKAFGGGWSYGGIWEAWTNDSGEPEPLEKDEAFADWRASLKR